MSGLNHTLNIGSESLMASRQGVDTAGHNIANAQTEGFSRQRVNTGAREPSVGRGVAIGNGVFVKNIERAHDSFLEKQIVETNQDLASSETFYESIKPLEDIYSPELSTTIADDINSFFNALQNLSNFPEEPTNRSNFKEAGLNLADNFKRVDKQLKDMRQSLNDRVAGQVEEVSTITQELASLNLTLKSLPTGNSNEAADILDRQDLLLNKLSSYLDISFYRTSFNSVVVRGPGETLLVERGFHASFEARPDEGSEGMYDVAIRGGNSEGDFLITTSNKKGSLAGLIKARDAILPDLIDRNNSMAYNLAGKFNEIHRQGYGLGEYAESSGRSFFNISEDVSQAARTITVDSLIDEDTSSISIASSPLAPGDNVIANALIQLKSDSFMDDGKSTLNEYYADYVGNLGINIVQAGHLKDADSALMNGLKARKEAVSGVSLDEEATNLLKWQSSFTASSKIITTIDEMLETVLGMKR